MNDASEVAIIGMAGLFPGADGLQAYWENIVNRVDAIGEPPPDWEQELFSPALGTASKIYCARGGYLRGLAQFDPLENGVMPSSVDGTEPDHFLALRLAHEALADSGYLDRPFNRQTTEVVVGRGTYVNRGNTTVVQHGLVVEQFLRLLIQLHPEYSEEQLASIRDNLTASLPPFSAETAPGLVPNIISGRIANRLDLMGGNYVVDAACASSLIAVDAARRDLLTGRCDMAIVGGVNASTSPPIMMIFCQLEAISRRGEIRPFDANADGTLLGEGGGMVVLKRLEDAERDNDFIYALVKEVGVASDGKAVGLLAPRVEGEEFAIRRAYEGSGIDPQTIGLIEAHGTGTSVGDAVEIQALNRVFGKPRRAVPHCALGTVKSMISHLLPASGIAGLIKTALALHHQVLPPTLHCEDPNPELGLDSSSFYLNGVARPWFQSVDSPRRAGVNAFGFGGINAHAILEEYPCHDDSNDNRKSLYRNWSSEVCVLSAPSREDLQVKIELLISSLESHSQTALVDIAYSMFKKNDGKEQLTVVAKSVDDLISKLQLAHRKISDPKIKRIKEVSGVYYFSEPLGAEGKVALIFPGEGSQYPWMMKDLCMHFPQVRKSFELVDRAFQRHKREVLPSEVVFPACADEKNNRSSSDAEIWDMDFGAEAVFTANQGMMELVRSLDIRADAMLGHSTGEHSALLASETVRIENDDELIDHILGVNAVYDTLKNDKDIPEAVLVAVGGAEPQLIEELISSNEDKVELAMDNCPHQVILSCAPDIAQMVTEKLQENLAICQILPFRRAYHTPRFQVFSEPLREYFNQRQISAPKCDLYSCVSADLYPEQPEEIRSLAAIQWSSRVRFRETIDLMYQKGVRIFLEVGPNNMLSGFVADILRGKDYAAIPSNTQHSPDIDQIMHMTAQLVAHGVCIDLSCLFERRQPLTIDLERPRSKPSNNQMPIKLGLQPIRLSDDFVLAKDDSKHIHRTEKVEPHWDQQIDVNPVTMGLKNESVPSGSAESTHPDGSGAHLSGQSTDTVIYSRQATPSNAGLQAHFRTMETLLDAESAVMRQYLLRKRSAGANNRTTLSSGHANANAAIETSATNMPFVSDILQFELQRKIHLRRHIDLSEDLFLTHHTLGRNISAFDPTLLALPVIPLTMSMEILAEAATVLMPKTVLVSMRDIRTYRWIVVGDEGVDLEILGEVNPDSSNEVVVRIYEKSKDANTGAVVVEGVMVFAPDYRPSPSSLSGKFDNERPSEWATEDLYSKGMFHGPAFQAVVNNDIVGQNGMQSTLVVPSRESLFKSNSNPGFVIDPIILDATGQVVAFWAQEVLPSHYDIFPYRLKELQIFGAPPSCGSVLKCRVEASLFGASQMTSDIDVTTETGELIYRLKGWEDRRFDLNKRFVNLRNSPKNTRIGTNVSKKLLATAEISTEESSVSLVDIFSAQMLEAHHGIWEQSLAALVLSRRERQQWQSLGKSISFKQHWLLGRVAAKDAVCDLVRSIHGFGLCPADVEITSDSSGRPGVKILDTECPVGQVSMSIAHSANAAVAIASIDGQSSFGVDIEATDKNADQSFSSLWSDQESRMLEELDSTDAGQHWRLRFWCAKEALAKALGAGIRIIDDIRINQCNRETECVTLELNGKAAVEFSELSKHKLVCATAQDNGNILAICRQSGA